MSKADARLKAEEVKRLVELDWSIDLKELPDGRYLGRVDELEGCELEADSVREVLQGLKKSRAKWIESALARGEEIPKPTPKYSGAIFVRTSRKLHEQVAKRAAIEGVSMSQWVGEVLAFELGRKEAADNR